MPPGLRALPWGGSICPGGSARCQSGGLISGGLCVRGLGGGLWYLSWWGQTEGLQGVRSRGPTDGPRGGPGRSLALRTAGPGGGGRVEGEKRQKKANLPPGQGWGRRRGRCGPGPPRRDGPGGRRRGRGGRSGGGRRGCCAPRDGTPRAGPAGRDTLGRDIPRPSEPSRDPRDLPTRRELRLERR